MIQDILNKCWTMWELDSFPLDRRMYRVGKELGWHAMSIENTNFLINEIVRRHDTDFYLEVGVWVGHSLMSAALYNPDVTCWGIENFSAHPDKKRLQGNLKHIIPKENVTVLFGDFEELLPKMEILNGEVGVYYYDGDHSYYSTLLGLHLAQPLLSPHSYILIDDLMMKQVEGAKNQFLLDKPEWKEVFCHIPEQNYTPWYTGFCVLERKPNEIHAKQ